MSTETPPSFQSIRFGELLKYLYKNARRIFLVAFVAAVIAAGVSLMMPNEYLSYANLLPANTPAIGLDALSRGSGGLSGIAGNILGKRTKEFDRFMILLETRAVMERVVNEFNLIEVYETGDAQFPMLNAIKKLGANTQFESFEEGNMVIQVWDQDPERAKAMADYYVALVNEYNIELATKEATVFREFVEAKYDGIMHTIDSLKTRVLEFQREYGVVELTSQAESYITMLATVTGALYQEEMKLSMIESTVNRDNPIYIRQKQQTEIVRSKLNELYNDQNRNNIILNYSELPQMSVEYMELIKNAELQEELLRFVVPLYENAKMEEVKAIPGLVVVDEPRVAERKSRPKRSLIVLGVGASVFFLMMVYYSSSLLLHRNREYLSYLRS